MYCTDKDVGIKYTASLFNYSMEVLLSLHLVSACTVKLDYCSTSIYKTIPVCLLHSVFKVILIWQTSSSPSCTDSHTDVLYIDFLTGRVSFSSQSASIPRSQLMARY